MEIDELAVRVRAVGATVTEAAGRLRHADPGPGGFAGDGPGRLGELGRELHATWSAALAAREREAAAAGARLADLAGALDLAARRYRDVDEAAGQRHGGVG